MSFLWRTAYNTIQYIITIIIYDDESGVNCLLADYYCGPYGWYAIRMCVCVCYSGHKTATALNISQLYRTVRIVVSENTAAVISGKDVKRNLLPDSFHCFANCLQSAICTCP